MLKRVLRLKKILYDVKQERSLPVYIDQLQDPTQYLFPSKVIRDLSIRNIHFNAFLNSHKPSYDPNTT